jgi:uncharacterized protein (DUF983 family)
MAIDYNETTNPALTGFKGRGSRCQRGHLFSGLTAACVVLLRPLKGWLVCSLYFHKAEEGRIDRDLRG